MPKDTDNVSKVVIYRQKTILFLKKNNNEWELPGGHLNVGESFLDGAKREVFEETSIKLKKLKVLIKQKDFMLFFAKPKDCTVRLSDEHVSYGWFVSKDVKKLNLTKATKVNLKTILNTVS